MEEVMKQGYKGEHDLFIARLQLDLIARYEGGLDAVKKVKRHFIKNPSEHMTPLLNFTDMLPELIQVGDFGLFKEIKDKYDSALSRDPTFIEVSRNTQAYIYTIKRNDYTKPLYIVSR